MLWQRLVFGIRLRRFVRFFDELPAAPRARS
jgi:hypothetical protein